METLATGAFEDPIRKLVDHIRAKAPEPLSVIPVSDVEKVTGLAWSGGDLRRHVLPHAKRALIRRRPAIEFVVTEDGLLVLDDAGRVKELHRREREALARYHK